MFTGVDRSVGESLKMSQFLSSNNYALSELVSRESESRGRNFCFVFLCKTTKVDHVK